MQSSEIKKESEGVCFSLYNITKKEKIMEMLIGLFIGGSLFVIFESIDYYYFDSFLKKRVFPNQNSIIVLDDEETYSLDAYHIKVSDDEMERITDGERISYVVEDFTRWKLI